MVMPKKTRPLRKLLLIALAAIVVGVGGLWYLTRPVIVSASDLPPYTPNLDNGKTMFAIGGCAACHAVPDKDPDKVDRTRLAGGLALNSPFGAFYVPNISPDPKDGIGGWTEANFISALWKGTAKDGSNLFPAFPYTSYQQMKLNDVRDLFAYLKTLPPVSGKSPPHDLSFPFNQRLLVGPWKLLYLHGGSFVPDPSQSAQWNRGAYLVNGPGHCAECHSPRDLFGGIVASERFVGGPAVDGDGWIPNITAAGLGHWGDDHIAWSEKDIADFLGEGINPAGDYAGGTMAEVIRNTSQLSPEDRAAMAAYIHSLPPVQGPTQKK
jgi:mono/diheme cytochrome c family protein